MMNNIAVFNLFLYTRDNGLYFEFIDRFRSFFVLRNLQEVPVNHGLNKWSADDGTEFYSEAELREVMELPVVQLGLEQVTASLSSRDLQAKLFCFGRNQQVALGYFVFSNGKWEFFK